jgi:uncharacterized repeat protein (TIGR04138 family)
MDKLNFTEVVEEIVRADGRFDPQTYYFVREGLDYTLKMLKHETQRGPRHVTGQELLNGLRQHALEQFGPMAKTVLEHWGVRRCEDFGEIVFRMVNKGVLGKTEQDRPEDFTGGFDFDEAFVKPFQPPPGTGLRRTTASRPNRRRLSNPEKLSGGTN